MLIDFMKLPYKMGGLEPYISKETLHFHHDKHYAKYVETTRRLVVGAPYEKMSLQSIVLASSRKGDEKSQTIFNNAAQALNHAFYWNCLTENPHEKPGDSFSKVLHKSFGSLEQFEKLFTESALNCFGSGWTWLTISKGRSLSIISTQGADNPLIFGLKPLLCCDVWEHAYYLDYKNDREKYLKNFFKVLNWKFVEQNFYKSSFSTRTEIDDMPVPPVS